MKKIILLLFVGILLMVGVLAENCQLATPRYGVVKCINTQQSETQTSSFGSFDGEWSLAQVNCLSNCQISALEDISILCEGIPWDVSEVYKNGVKKDSFPISWGRGDILSVKGKCTTIVTNSQVPANSKIEYSQDKIMLEESWAGSLEYTPITGSEGCVLNKNYDSTNINSYLDLQSGEKINKPSSTYSSLSQFPYNWKINDNYVFIKDWQTGIADISLTYDKNNNGYWCGGQYGSRKIYSVQEITSSTGTCYAIPQSIYLSNVECCFPSDCVNQFGAQYTCNPDIWKCEQTKPCNSQLDCDQTFGEGVCQNNQINQWVCDLTKKWGDYQGTCVHSSKQITNCPSDCNNKEYYNEEQGKCLTRTGLIEENKNNSEIPGQTLSTTSNSSPTGTIILIIILLIIGGSIGFFIYVKNKKNKSHHKENKEEEKSKEIKSGKHCTKCGHPLNKGSLFCTKCGHKLKK